MNIVTKMKSEILLSIFICVSVQCYKIADFKYKDGDKMLKSLMKINIGSKDEVDDSESSGDVDNEGSGSGSEEGSGLRIPIQTSGGETTGRKKETIYTPHIVDITLFKPKCVNCDTDNGTTTAGVIVGTVSACVCLVVLIAAFFVHRLTSHHGSYTLEHDLP